MADGKTSAVPYAELYGTSAGGVPKAGEVLPIRMPNGTQGFGRFDSISQAALLFYSTDYGPNKDVSPSAAPATRMRAIFLMQFNNAAQGLGAIRNHLRYTVKGLEQLQIQFSGGTSYPLFVKLPGSNSNGSNYIEASEISLYHGRAMGGAEMPNLGLYGKTITDCYPDTNTEPQSPEAGVDKPGKGMYPFFSPKDIAIPPRQKLFDFTGNPNQDITVEISDVDAAATTPFQIIHLKFPAATGALGLRVPQKGQMQKFVPPTPATSTSAMKPTQCFMARDIQHSYGMIDGSQMSDEHDPTDKNGAPDGNDTVISLQVGGIEIGTGNPSSNPQDDPSAGDSRLVAASHEVPSNYFRAHNDYLNTGTTRQYAHGFLMGTGEYMHGGKYGKLAPVPDKPVRAYYQGPVTARQPDVPSRAKNGVYRDKSAAGPGDWDTGWGDQKDGAYINKPDEGDTLFTDTYGSGFRTPYALGFAKGFASADNGYFAPTRLVPSPMMFGSLPTGVLRPSPGRRSRLLPARKTGATRATSRRETTCSRISSGCRWSSPMRSASRLRPAARST